MRSCANNFLELLGKSHCLNNASESQVQGQCCEVTHLEISTVRKRLFYYPLKFICYSSQSIYRHKYLKITVLVTFLCIGRLLYVYVIDNLLVFFFSINISMSKNK